VFDFFEMVDGTVVSEGWAIDEIEFFEQGVELVFGDVPLSFADTGHGPGDESRIFARHHVEDGLGAVTDFTFCIFEVFDTFMGHGVVAVDHACLPDFGGPFVFVIGELAFTGIEVEGPEHLSFDQGWDGDLKVTWPGVIEEEHEGCGVIVLPGGDGGLARLAAVCLCLYGFTKG